MKAKIEYLTSPTMKVMSFELLLMGLVISNLKVSNALFSKKKSFKKAFQVHIVMYPPHYYPFYAFYSEMCTKYFWSRRVDIKNCCIPTRFSRIIPIRVIMHFSMKASTKINKQTRCWILFHQKINKKQSRKYNRVYFSFTRTTLHSQI